jgi:hypothetical protein
LFERQRDGRGIVQFPGTPPYVIFGQGACSKDRDRNVVELAEHLSRSGIVLLLTTSVSRAEKLASLTAGLRQERDARSDSVDERVDARIERELYSESPLRGLYRKGVVFHHSRLPPRVREALEEAISTKRVEIICATTTLAEGVNFPFSTLIVDSLVGQNYELSPRDLWNIAGRAGRFGVDTEGHCILFRPSAWKNKLRRYRLEEYLSQALDDIPPVRSAFADAIIGLKSAIDDGEIELDDLTEISLDKIKIKAKATKRAKEIRGLVNVMRVGYAHASQSGTISLTDEVPEEFESGSVLAARQLPPAAKQFAYTVAKQQRAVVNKATLADEELLAIAAKVGWSMETQNTLYEWLRSRDDWQLEQFGQLVLGGRVVDHNKLGYLLGPLCDRMAEFEGDRLGGFTSFIATGWLEGLPLTNIRATRTKRMDFGRLVQVIYSRVQYMLPWALFGCSELILYEAARRNLTVGSGVRDLAALASEGVPSFDAIQLVLQCGVERVDATRLAEAYHKRHEKADILGWFGGIEWKTVAGIVRGVDRRRIDPDLRQIWHAIRIELEK